MAKLSLNLRTNLRLATKSMAILVPLAAIVISLVFWLDLVPEHLLLVHPFRSIEGHRATYNGMVISVSSAGLGIRNHHAEYDLDKVFRAGEPDWARKTETNWEAPEYWSGSTLRQLSDHSCLAVRVTSEDYRSPMSWSGLVNMHTIWAVTVMIGHAAIITASAAMLAMVLGFLHWRRSRRSVFGFPVEAASSPGLRRRRPAPPENGELAPHPLQNPLNFVGGSPRTVLNRPQP